MSKFIIETSGEVSDDAAFTCCRKAARKMKEAVPVTDNTFTFINRKRKEKIIVKFYINPKSIKFEVTRRALGGRTG